VCDCLCCQKYLTNSDLSALSDVVEKAFPTERPVKFIVYKHGVYKHVIKTAAVVTTVSTLLLHIWIERWNAELTWVTELHTL